MDQERTNHLRYARELHKRLCVNIVQRNVTQSTTMPQMDIGDRMTLQNSVNRISELNREINDARVYERARKRLDQTRDAMLLRREFAKEVEVKTRALKHLGKRDVKSEKLTRRIDRITDLNTEAEEDLTTAVDALVAPHSEQYSDTLFDTQDVRDIYDDIVDSALGCQSSDLTDALICMRAQDGELKNVPVCDTQCLPDVPNALPH